jgi:hypothetical protein
VNTINGKTGLYKVPIEFNTIRDMNKYDDLVRYASQPKPVKNKTYTYNEKARAAFEKTLKRIEEEEKAKVNTKLAKEFIQKKQLLP